MCMGSSAAAPAPVDKPSTEPRTFAYGPKGVEKTAVDIPKENEEMSASAPAKRKTDTAALNITT